MAKRLMPDVIRSTISEFGAARPRGDEGRQTAHFQYKRNGLNIRRSLGIAWTINNRARIERALNEAVREIERVTDQRRHVTQWIADVEGYLAGLDDPAEANKLLNEWAAKRISASRKTLFDCIEEYRQVRLTERKEDGREKGRKRRRGKGDGASKATRRLFAYAVEMFFGVESVTTELHRRKGRPSIVLDVAAAEDRPMDADALRLHLAERLKRLRDAGNPILSPVTGRPYDDGTINSRARSMRAFLRYCTAVRYLDTDPMSELTIPERSAKSAVQVYSLNQFKRLLVIVRRRERNPPSGKTAYTYQWFAVLLGLLRLSGLRISEALSLRWVDAIDDPTVENHIGAQAIEIRQSKTDSPRRIPFAVIRGLPEIIDALRSLPRAPGGWVFPVRSNKTIWERMLRMFAAAGVPRPKAPLHAWRATAVNLWRAQDIPEASRNYLAGHGSEVAREAYEREPSIEMIIREARGGTGE